MNGVLNEMIFLAAIAALYAIMSVGLSTTRFKKCLEVIRCSEKVKGVRCSNSLAHKQCSFYFLTVTAALYVMCVG